MDYIKATSPDNHSVGAAALLAAWLYICDKNEIGYEQATAVFERWAGAMLKRAS